MPSPFPGMDPHVEAARIWPGFHNRLASEMSTVLNKILPGSYYADLETRAELGVIEEANVLRRIVPGLAVVRHHGRPSGHGVAVLEQPRRESSLSHELTVHAEPVRHDVVEIRDAASGYKLITLIEILSPSNKRPGPDRDAYQRKQRNVLDSDASLIEVDLLRAGDHVLPDPTFAATIAQIEPRPDYLVWLNRAWERAGGVFRYQYYTINLRDWLPCISIPLKQGEPEIALDLQFVFNRAYDAGPYRRGAINYAQLPDPPLFGPDAEWAEALLRDYLRTVSPP